MLPRIGPCRAVLVHSPSRRMRPAAARAASSLLPFSTSGHCAGCLLNTPPLVVPGRWHTRADRAREHNRRPRTGAYSHAYSHAYSGAYSGPLLIAITLTRGFTLAHGPGGRQPHRTGTAALTSMTPHRTQPVTALNRPRFPEDSEWGVSLKGSGRLDDRHHSRSPTTTRLHTHHPHPDRKSGTALLAPRGTVLRLRPTQADAP